jgi:lipopolysaccharide transport system ATP-binding protein
MDDIAIRLEHVSKKFCRYLRRSMLYGVQDIGRNLLRIGTRADRLRKDEFWAVDDVSFDLRRGETLGLIGPNGSGKSTILKMLNGIFMPDKGKIEIKGRVGALIEVGAGFHPVLTGRENIYINGTILGMGKREIDEKFEAIVDFADIGDFLDTPVKHYSSGMLVRLGFAIASHVEPEILLVDEVLAVGDFRFQRKCFKRIGELCASGTSIIFITHNLFTLGGLCARTILLEGGKIQTVGDTKAVVETYELREKEKETRAQISQDENKQVHHEFKPVEIISSELLNIEGNPCTTFSFDEPIKIRLHWITHQRIDKPLFMFGFRRSDNTIVTHYNSRFDNFNVDCIEGKASLEVELPATHLADDFYTIHFGIWNWNSPHFFGKLVADMAGYEKDFVVGQIRVKHPFFRSIYGVSEGRARKWTLTNGKRELTHADIPNNTIYEAFEDKGMT